MRRVSLVSHLTSSHLISLLIWRSLNVEYYVISVLILFSSPHVLASSACGNGFDHSDAFPDG
jgi:hypothetical protein